MTEAILDTGAELRMRLCNLLNEVSQGKINVSASQIQAPLKELGLDSVVLLGFLVAIEDMVSMEWPADVPKATFASIWSIAQYIDSAHA
jgi:acyl carrier protein